MTSRLEVLHQRMKLLERLQKSIANSPHFTDAERFDVKFEYDAAETEIMRLQAAETSAADGQRANHKSLEQREAMLDTIFDETTPADVMCIFVAEHERLRGAAASSD